MAKLPGPETLELFDMHPGVDARNQYCLRSGHNFIDCEITGEPRFIDETLAKVARYFQANKAWQRGDCPDINRRSYHLWHPENTMRTRSTFKTNFDESGKPLETLLHRVTVAFTKEEAFRFFYVDVGTDSLQKPHRYTVWPYMTQELPEDSRVHFPTRKSLVKRGRDNNLFLPEGGGYEDSLHEYHTPLIRKMEERGRYGGDHSKLETTLENLSHSTACLADKHRAGLVYVERIGINPEYVGFWLGFYRVPWQQKTRRKWKREHLRGR